MFAEEDEVVADEVELPAVYGGDLEIDDMVEYGESAVTPQFVAQAVPDIVVNFLRHLQQAIAERSAWELHGLYENSFNKLSEKFFAKGPWPTVDVVAAIVGEDDQIFLILYKELYYRHLYSKLQPSLEDRISSYANYCDLFNFILNSSEEPSDLELPNQWLWDITDEFIYQFQAFCQFRSKLHRASDADVETLKDRPDVWNVLNVLNVLYSLIAKSRINEQLWVSRNGGDMMEAAGEFGSRPLYRMLGYFSIVGLLRVHCLLGDYTMALKMMENIELQKKGLFARVTACHVTTYYYISFAYMMMRRYSDAIKALAHILLFVSRTKHYHTRSMQYEAISKKCEQMYALLAICVALSPQRIDENVHTVMREKYGEHLLRLQKDSEEAISTFKELFEYACPKFISPAPPKYDDFVNQSHAPLQIQLRVFVNEVKQQLLVPTIRSYLKLYTTLKVEKLALFVEKTPEELSTELLVFKHKTRQRRWESGGVMDGEYSTSSDLDFSIKGENMIYVTETKVGRRVGDWFIRHIEKFEDQINRNK